MKNYTMAIAIASSLSFQPQIAEAKRNNSTQNSGFQRPNIILINLDDMGYGDPSCYGGKLIETPNMDRLATEGVKCTNGYVSAPVSGVSRMGLLTGSYQQRYGMQWNHDQWAIAGLEDKPALPAEHKQIQSAFKEAGYATAMAGKIGVKDAQPFDKYYSHSWNGVSFFPDESGRYSQVDVVPGEPKAKGFPELYWGPEREGDEYLTDRCARQCIEFIEENKENSFFFYMALNAPHTPLQAKKSDRKRVEHIDSEVAQLYNAMLLAVDDNLGRILDYLEKSKLRDNTIVILLSDNGPANPTFLRLPKWWPEGQSYHILGQRAGLNGCKGTFWEGGIRVPYIISWPKGLEQGVTYTPMVSTMDLYPTLCSAARVRIPDNTHLDGVDLLPYLNSQSSAEPHETLFWYANRMGAVRKGEWKLLIEENKHYLFNIESDMGETKDVAKQNPKVTHDLMAEFIGFRNQMPPYRNPFARPIDVKDPSVIGMPIVEATRK